MTPKPISSKLCYVVMQILYGLLYIMNGIKNSISKKKRGGALRALNLTASKSINLIESIEGAFSIKYHLLLKIFKALEMPYK